VPAHREEAGVARQAAADGSIRSSSRRGTSNEQRWEEILAAAAEEFYENGYKAARLQDIAHRVGLLTGSLYYYIDSKEDLLFALVDSAHRKGLAITEEGDTADDDAPRRLRAFVERHVRLQLESRADSITVVERDRIHLSPEHRAQVDTMRRTLHRAVIDIIDQGIAEGSFDPSIDPAMAASTLFATLNSTREWARGRELSEIADWYSRLFVNGLAPAGTREPARPARAGSTSR
jgi:AcrR family transcriptional regulator